jgi:hypothetical protein
LAGDCALFDTPETRNDFKLKKDAEERKLHRMAKVHNILKQWQRSRTLCTTQKEYRARNKQMTDVQSISDTEQIMKAS